MKNMNMLIALFLCSVALALTPAQILATGPERKAGQSAAGASTLHVAVSRAGSDAPSVPSEAQVREFLHANKSVELPVRGLGRFSVGRGIPSLTLLEDKSFTIEDRWQTRRDWTRGEGALSVSGNTVSGVAGFVAPDNSRQARFVFSIVVSGLAPGRMRYGVSKLCMDTACLVDADLCWQASDKPDHDCTERPIYPLLTKPTKQKITDFVAAVDFALTPDVFVDDGVARILLGAERAFSLLDLNNSMDPCRGTYTISASSLVGKCQGSTESFSVSIDGLAPGVVTYRLTRCDGDQCVTRPVAAWGAPHGSREDTGGGFLLELIPGSADRTLFDAVQQRLQTAFADEWQAAGSRVLPLLFVGPPARKARTQSEVFYAKESKAAAEAAANLLAPVIGPTTVQPWPGEWDYHVIVVVGDKSIGTHAATEKP